MNPNIELFFTRTDKDGFWNRVDVGKPDQCWLWLGPMFSGPSKISYGRFKFHGKEYRAHRVAFLFVYDRWPKFCCLHTCDNPSCCNPRHLFEGTQIDNIADRTRKGRSARKLTDKDIEEILTLYPTGQYTQRELAEKFGLRSHASISLLINNKRKGVSY